VKEILPEVTYIVLPIGKKLEAEAITSAFEEGAEICGIPHADALKFEPSNYIVDWL
jgi:hypothetical protein